MISLEYGLFFEDVGLFYFYFDCSNQKEESLETLRSDGNYMGVEIDTSIFICNNDPKKNFFRLCI